MAIAQFKTEIRSHYDARAFLAGKLSRKLAHNTEVYQNGTDGIDTHGASFNVRYHKTDIVSYYGNGAIVLRSGGWDTITTRGRIDKLLPPGLRIFREKGETWVLDSRLQFRPDGVSEWDKSLRVPFRDGMLILPDVSLHGTDRDSQERIS